MLLPPDSLRSRFLWSIPAVIIIVFWSIGVLGAAVIGFIERCNFLEVLTRIAKCESDMFWPGEFGLYTSIEGPLIQLGPLLALILWPLCLVPWRTRRMRLASIAAALLIPAGLLVIAPHYIVVGLATAWPAIFGTQDGEFWQDGMVALTGASFWWWLLVPLFVLTAIRRMPFTGEHRCPTCGYSTIGLKSNACPECGGAIPPGSTRPEAGRGMIQESARAA